MKLSAPVASTALRFLRRAIPKGHAEADELMILIRFFESVVEGDTNKSRDTK